MVCLPCATGYHFECWRPNNTPACCCHDELKADGMIANAKAIVRERRGRKNKATGEVKDVESTGRKRAAILYPLDREAPCEWQGKKNVGGGVEPIVGCINGLQSNIHHGPDKNTLNNDPDNISRICARCHNRWHTANDKYYAARPPVGNVPFVPRPPLIALPLSQWEIATPEELVENELRYAK